MSNGTLYIVTSNRQLIPEIRMITSTGLIALNTPENIAAREPTEKDIQRTLPGSWARKRGRNRSRYWLRWIRIEHGSYTLCRCGLIIICDDLADCHRCCSTGLCFLIILVVLPDAPDEFLDGGPIITLHICINLNRIDNHTETRDVNYHSPCAPKSNDTKRSFFAFTFGSVSLPFFDCPLFPAVFHSVAIWCGRTSLSWRPLSMRIGTVGGISRILANESHFWLHRKENQPIIGKSRTAPGREVNVFSMMSPLIWGPDEA